MVIPYHRLCSAKVIILSHECTRSALSLFLLLHLYRIGGIDRLSPWFATVRLLEAFIRELDAGRSRGYECLDPEEQPNLRSSFALRQQGSAKAKLFQIPAS